MRYSWERAKALAKNRVRLEGGGGKLVDALCSQRGERGFIRNNDDHCVLYSVNLIIPLVFIIVSVNSRLLK